MPVRVRIRLLAACICAVTCTSSPGAPVITNGNFETSVFPANVCPNSLTQCNIEIDNNYPAGVGIVTGWAATGYAIYFLAGQQSTQSAQGRWYSSGKEMLDTRTTLSPNGGNFVALDADPTIASTIAQTVSGFTAGNQYYLTFYWGASQLQSRTGATNEQVELKITNSTRTDLDFLSAQVNINSQRFSGWKQETVSFLATSTIETITFLAKSTSTCLPPMVLIDGVAFTTPEPGTKAMLGAGIVLLIGSRWWRRRPAGERRCSVRS